MNRKMKMLSIIVFVIMLACSLFSTTALAANASDTIQSEIAGEIIASDGKAVVAVILHGKDDILTKSEIAAEYSGISKWNTKNGDQVSTGDTFTVGSNNYTVAIYGDVDSNGFVDSSDALYIERVVVKLPGYSFNEIQRIAADVDSVDGRLNSTDSLRIKKFKVGLADTTVIGNPTKKEDPKPEVPKNLTAVYGQTLANVKLPTSDKGTYVFEDPSNTLVGNVGNNTFSVIYIPNDLSKYKVVRISVTIKVEKAEPAVEAPKGLTATVGDTLADVELPTSTIGTWEWFDASTTSVGAAGNNAFKAIFNPSDTDNFKSKTVNVTIAVAAANVPTEKITSIVLTENNDTTTNYCYKDIEVATIAATTESNKIATINTSLLALTTDSSNATAKILNGKIVLNATQAGTYNITFTKKGVATDAKITTSDDSLTEITKITASVKEDETINKVTVKDSAGKEVSGAIDLFAGKDNNYYTIVFSHDYGEGKRNVEYVKSVSDVTLDLGSSGAFDANTTKFYNGANLATGDFDRLRIVTANVTSATTGTIKISVDGKSKDILVNVKPVQLYEIAIVSSEKSLVDDGEVIIKFSATGSDSEDKVINVGTIGLAASSSIKVQSTMYGAALSRIFTITQLNEAGSQATGNVPVKGFKLTFKSGITLDSTITYNSQNLVVKDVLKDGISIIYNGVKSPNSDTTESKTVTFKFEDIAALYEDDDDEENGNSTGQDSSVQNYALQASPIEVLGLEVKEQPTEITKAQVEKLAELYEQIELNVKVKTRGEESSETVTLADLKEAGATVEADKSVDGKVTIKVTYEGKSVEVTINVKADEATSKPAKSPAKVPANNTVNNTNSAVQDGTNTDKDAQVGNKTVNEQVKEPETTGDPEKVEDSGKTENSDVPTVEQPEVSETPVSEVPATDADIEA